MKKNSLLVALVALTLTAVAQPAAAIVPNTFYGASTVELHVNSSTGNDVTAAGTTAAAGSSTSPFRTIKGAISVIPSGFIAPVVIVLSAATHALTDQSIPILPASTTVLSAKQTGSITIRGSCTSLKTWTASVSWSAIGSKKSQVTGDIGAWSGSVTDGSHFVRVGSGPYTYKTVRASTSSNLKVVDSSTTAYAGELCAYGSTVSGSPTFSAPTPGEGAPFVIFEAVSFSGSPNFQGVKLQGVKLAPGTLENVTASGAYFSGDVDLVGYQKSMTAMTAVLVTDCVKLHGTVDKFSGVVAPSAYCGGGQVLIGGTTGVDGGAFIPKAADGTNYVRQFEATDIEGQGTCIYMVGSVARLGGGNASHDLTCNPLDAGVCAELHAGSNLSIYDTRSTLTGSARGPTVIKNGSVLGPLNGSWDLTTVGSDAGDYTNGTTVGVRESANLPHVNATELTRVY